MESKIENFTSLITNLVQPLTPFLTFNMAESCKFEINSEFLNLESFLVKLSAKSEKIITGLNLTSKSQNFDIWPYFLPQKWQNHENLTWTVNFLLQKYLWWFGPIREKEISSLVTKSVNFRKIQLFRNALLRKALLQKLYFWSQCFQGRTFSWNSLV